jgi:hypothetical protein
MRAAGPMGNSFLSRSFSDLFAWDTMVLERCSFTGV